MSDADTLKSEVQGLIQLFETELAGVRFPDADGGLLAEGLERVKDRQAEAAQAAATLQASRAALDAERESLMRKAQRALAYLRIYAESDAALGAKLEALAFRPVASSVTSAGPPDAAPKRRGRPRKISGGDLLFPDASPDARLESEAASA